MRIVFAGDTSAHALGIKSQMILALQAVRQLGAERAHLACERRRTWLLSQLRAAWLAPRLWPLTADLAATELEPPFVPFTFPEQLYVEFRTAPIPGLAADCPLAATGGPHLRPGWAHLTVWEGAVGPDLRSRDLTVRQLTFRELVRACGESRFEGLARLHWAAVGALTRASATPAEPVDVDDGRALSG